MEKDTKIVIIYVVIMLLAGLAISAFTNFFGLESEEINREDAIQAFKNACEDLPSAATNFYETASWGATFFEDCTTMTDAEINAYIEENAAEYIDEYYKALGKLHNALEKFDKAYGNAAQFIK